MFRHDQNLSSANNSKTVKHHQLEDNETTFQIIDWYKTDVISEDICDKDGHPDGEKLLVIKAFGTDSKGYSVSLNILGYEPYFYIQLKKIKRLTQYNKLTLINILKDALPMKLKEQFKLRTVSKKTLWGFTNNSQFQYIKDA